MTKRSVVYAIVDGFGSPVYVGQSQKLLAYRLSQHFSVARAGSWSRPLDRWLREHPEASIVPLEVDPPDADEAERTWIAQIRAGGNQLLNITPGGKRGCFGAKRSPDAVEKTASKLRGRKQSDEHRAKLSAAHLGVPLSDEHRAAIGRGGALVPRTPEWNENLSKAKRGDKNPMSAVQRAARAAAAES